MVVDDDPDIGEVLQDRLESYGYVVAAGGRAALVSIERLASQGLIIDILTVSRGTTGFSCSPYSTLQSLLTRHIHSN